ncbi:hypothetical protein QBC47DRAFT_384278 [Echria macrotheca]|uniref:Uncharacterized protein n=1 Tax=Echria macrotheca TaxID=438768 RepID=A0AAJ0FAS3_9PEZI|nr:hypothetical protein QBC47DRAFT_384278 [Echria macrotheca]
MNQVTHSPPASQLSVSCRKVPHPRHQIFFVPSSAQSGHTPQLLFSPETSPLPLRLNDGQTSPKMPDQGIIDPVRWNYPIVPRPTDVQFNGTKDDRAAQIRKASLDQMRKASLDQVRNGSLDQIISNQTKAGRISESAEKKDSVVRSQQKQNQRVGTQQGDGFSASDRQEPPKNHSQDQNLNKSHLVSEASDQFLLPQTVYRPERRHGATKASHQARQKEVR